MNVIVSGDHAKETNMDRAAIAVWDGKKVKSGTLTTDSGSLIEMPYSPAARYELEARPSALGRRTAGLSAARCDEQ